jgi:uncharacterized delta-60 repeat protein
MVNPIHVGGSEQLMVRRARIWAAVIGALLAGLWLAPGATFAARGAACQAAPCVLAPSQGTTLTDFSGGIDRANALGVDADGRIVAAGESTTGGVTDLAIARYLPDGGLDPSFGTNGTILTNFGRSANGANAIAIWPGGRIVVAGYSGVEGGGFDFALARYRTDGQLDPSFGVGGQVITDFVDTRGVDVAKAVAIQADGKLVVSGYSGTYGEDFDFVVARFRRGGGLDRSFGGDGHVLTNFGGDDASQAVGIQADGKIVAMGKSEQGGDFDFALARYLPDGSLDASFGEGGRVRDDLSGTGSFDYGLAGGIDERGRIIDAGKSDAAGNLDFALARYRPNGRLDRSFGHGGVVLTDFGGESLDVANAIAVRPDGGIIAAGSSDATGSSDLALVSYLPDGTPDPAFGTGGTSLIDVGGTGGFDSAKAVVLDGGWILAGGLSDAGGTSDFVLAAIQPLPGADHDA